MAEEMQTPSSEVMQTRRRRAVLERLGAYLLPSLIAAFIAGFLIAGVGGRLAMFLLRVTSGDHVVGMESDDGFIIGRFTSSTIFLVLVLTVGSAVALGPLFALVRVWFPAAWRAPILAVYFGVVGGALLVHREGVDFTVLSPRALAVGLFVAIPAAFGAALEPLRKMVEPWTSRLPRRLLIGVPVLASAAAIAGPPGLGLVILAWGTVLLGQGERAGEALRSRQAALVGSLLLIVSGALAVVDLARDVRRLLL